MFSSEEERRRKEEKAEARGWIAIAGIAVFLMLLVTIFAYAIAILSLGSLVFPAIFGLLYRNKLAPPRRYPLKPVALITAIDFGLITVLWAFYPIVVLSLGLPPTPIALMLPTWVGLGNFSAGMYLLRQFKNRSIPSVPRFSIKPHLISIALCLMLGLWFSHIQAHFNDKPNANAAKYASATYARQVKEFERQQASQMPDCKSRTRFRCVLFFFPLAPARLPQAERQQYYDRCVPLMRQRNEVADPNPLIDQPAEAICAKQTGVR